MDLSERGVSLVRHPWERARARFFLDVLEQHRALGGRVLDVGAGDAWLADQLRKRSPRAHVSLWDVNYRADEIEALERRGFRASTERPAGPFDLLMMLDVIEHTDDDRAFVRHVLKSAAPGARVLVSVPAWSALWSAHDVALAHRRRYSPEQMRALLGDAGLAITESGGVFHSLLAPRAISVALERAGFAARDNGVGGWGAGELAARAIAAGLSFEHKLSRALSSRGIDAPGLSFWAIARVASSTTIGR